jgi:DNA-binding LacI/PurR family transcriptional regulator
MSAIKELKPVIPQAGKPLYLTVKDAVREAISKGVFSPGEQMPSTKELSEQLSVSLVTAHRALQELVTAGILQRSQGKGTFVHQRYLDREKNLSVTRLGLVFHREASVADFYHSQILEGVRQAAQQLNVDLVLLRFGEDVRNECNGYLFVNPLPSEVDGIVNASGRNQPILIVGARHGTSKRIACIDVDNVDLASEAVNHLAGLGHARLAYVGGADQLSNSRDRWEGFRAGCESRGMAARPEFVIKGESWRLDERERNALIRALTGPNRPTAVFAAGYYFALDVYAAASTSGLRIPEDLSVVGVDDPPSAALLAPPMTTLRQPLVQLGHAAVTALFERIRNEAANPQSRTLRAELVIRRSSAAAAK